MENHLRGNVTVIFCIISIFASFLVEACLLFGGLDPLFVIIAPFIALAMGIAALVLECMRLQRERRGSSLNWTLLLCVIACILPVVAFSMVSRELSDMRRYGQCIRCASNLKQIGLALDAYAKSNNGYFPSGKGVAGMEMLRSQSYISDYKLFICPTTGAASGSDNAPLNDANCSYIYLGAGLSTKDSPDSPILMDKPDNHAKYGNILFVDGHVRGFTGSNWQNQH